MIPSRNRVADRDTIINATDVVARLLRILLSCGISIDEIRSMCKQALPNVSSAVPPKMLSATAEQHIAYSDLVLRWRRFPEYLLDNGSPAPLPFHGHRRSFSHLVSEAAPGHDANVVATYLMQVGTVTRDLGNRIHLMAESVLVSTGHDFGTVAPIPLLAHLNSFLGSVEYNLLEREGNRNGRFERACYAQVPGNLVPVLERFVEARGQNFVDVVDEWLSRQPVSDASVEMVTVGAGAYVFVQPKIEK